MANPLQQFFRQPKIYVSLPSKGAYCKPGTIQGDPGKLAIYGMTGMDEIMAKTPDALLSGESSVKIIESCCPSIKDAWDLSSLDTELIFAAIRVATYGNNITVTHTCGSCKETNEYDLDLSVLISHFGNCKFDSTIVLDDLVIKIQPLSYKKKTEFGLKNFRVQQKLAQIEVLEDDELRKTQLTELFKELGQIQNDVFMSCVESVEANGQLVTEHVYIDEWLANCDRIVFDKINKKIEENILAWIAPKYNATCGSCKKELQLGLELDQSNFFD
jgi:hypothetical protein